MSAKPNVSCIIPAYNEAARIGQVLSVVLRHPLIAEVIVVDDGSSDATAAIVEGMAGVTLIRLPKNRGKTWAVSVGIEAARHPLLLFLDSDLEGLEADHLTALIGAVRNGGADVSISLRQNAPKLWHWLGLDYISGERVLPKSLFEGRTEGLRRLPRFGFEVHLNGLWIGWGLRICVVKWPGVASPYKQAKRGIWAGVKADVAMMRDIFRTVPPLDILRQILAMRGLRVAGGYPARRGL